MFVRLLGPVELVGEAGPVRLGGEKERTALAAMALALPHPVHSGQLVAALWGAAPPRTAVKSMQSYVSRLRSVLGDAVASTATGYVLRLDVDLQEAERLVADGLQRLAEGHAALAAERFGAALDLWTGPSLSGVAVTDPMELERARLDELARTTAEHRIAALLECGHGPTLVGEVEVMVGEEPLREQRWAHLLTALYRSGRQADALRAYQRLRSTLADNLGIDPSAELQELERRILARDPSLDPQPASTRELPGDRVDRADRPTIGDLLPLPDRLGSAIGSFAGRTAELTRLRAAWDRVTTHGRRGVLLAGEPGIGKSTLMGRFAHAVQTEGAAVVFGECSEDLGAAYHPWIEILAPLVEHLPEEILADHVDACGAVLARLVPALDRRLDIPPTVEAEPDAERYLLFGGVVDLLGRTPAPLLVVIDDLHWADRPTVQLLRHVMSSSALPDVLVMGAYRPTDVDQADPLPRAIAELRRVDGVDMVTLDGLDDAELLELLQVTGHEFADGGRALRDALAAETGGNPFFALEILRHLAETGVLVRGDDDSLSATGESFELGLPVSVRQVIGQRIARLGGITHRVLREAAVIGREFDLELLAGVADVDPEELLELLDAAVTAGVIVNPQGDCFRFAHSLIEHSLYAELLPARRVRSHRRVARLLERRSGGMPGDRVGELAHHWTEAIALDGADRAITWSRRAGRHAMETLAPDEAVRWFSHALDLLDSGSGNQELQRALQVELGNAERQAGDPVHRQRLLDTARLARKVGDVEVLVEAALANNSGVYSTFGEIDHERVAVLEAAMLAIDESDDRSRARLLATLSAELTFSGSSSSQQLAADAVAAARRCGEVDTLCDVLNLTELSQRVPWLLDERDRHTRELLDLTGGGDDPVRRFSAVLKRHHLLLVRGERAEARGYFEEAARIEARLELPILRWTILTNQVLDAVLDGDLDLAERQAEAALAFGSSGDEARAFTYYSAQLMEIRRRQDRLGELVPAITRLVEENPAVAIYAAVLANAHARAGETDLARAVFADLMAELDRVPATSVWSMHMGLLADTAVVLDDHHAAADLYQRLAPYGHQISIVVGVACDGAISHRLGCLADLLGRRDDAVAHLTDALDRHRRLESPIHVEQSVLELARVTA